MTQTPRLGCSPPIQSTTTTIKYRTVFDRMPGSGLAPAGMHMNAIYLQGPACGALLFSCAAACGVFQMDICPNRWSFSFCVSVRSKESDGYAKVKFEGNEHKAGCRATLCVS